MHMVAYRNTEASIREIRARKTQLRETARVAGELAAMQRRIEALQAKVNEVSKPVIIDDHWSRSPVVKSVFQRIEARACKLFRVKRAELYSCRRQRKLALARHFVMYWACRLTTLSLPQIGRLMGGRDHTTILHGRDAYPQKRAAMGRHLREVR
jgi:chromosomal replication initiation ATPase DnaA